VVTSTGVEAMLEERDLVSDAGRTHIWLGGQGPALLLLHGAGPGVNAELNWSHIWDRLASRHYCIAPDLLGFGASEAPAELLLGAAAWADARSRQVIASLDALGIDRAHIVGNSAGGGAVGLRLLTANPDRVERVVLMGGAGTRPAPGAVPAAFYDNPSPDTMERTIRRLIHDPNRAPQPLPEVARKRYELAMRPGAERAFRAMHSRDEAHGGSEAAIGPALAPVLLLHGAEDRVSPVDTSIALREKLVSAHLHVVPDAGHWIHVDQPDAFCGLVEGFLTEAW
jgi:2-hydroxymuconate-semialdehyde hydrolase